MSIELMDEHEQGERVRAWIRENGASVISGIAIGVAAIIGWQWWGQSQAGHRADAAAQYSALQDAAGRADRDGVEALMKSLDKDFADTSYPALGALRLADLQSQAGENEAAIATLSAAAKRAAEPALKALISSRQARAELAAGKAEAALKTLAAIKGEGIAPMLNEIKGDALVQLGRTDEAIQAYRAAAEGYDETLPNKRLVELKLADLGAAKPESKPEV